MRQDHDNVNKVRPCIITTRNNNQPVVSKDRWFENSQHIAIVRLGVNSSDLVVDHIIQYSIAIEESSAN